MFGLWFVPLSNKPVFEVRQPNLYRGQSEKSAERAFGFIISGSHPAKLFEPVEHALDSVSVLVGFEIAGRWVLPVGLWRNDGAKYP
jgi:hypothetical protein